MALSSVLAGAAPAGAAPQARANTSRVQWGACPADVHYEGLQCATVRVPLDYRHPNGRKITLAISRLASTRPELRRGLLLTNPGGPGGGGLDFPGELREQGLPQKILDAYDIIGVDHRGTGLSTPITCNLAADQYPTGNLAPYPRDRQDVNRQAHRAKAVAGQCARAKTAYMLPHMNTATIARDFDQIRSDLGERKASFLGYSYGTYLGAVYATMFPKRADRIVLDSSLGPGGLDRAAMQRWGAGFDRRFPDFARFAAKHPEYHLGNTPTRVLARYRSIANKVKVHPVGPVDGSTLPVFTFGQLYTEDGFPQLAEFLHAVDQGDTSQPSSTDAAEPSPVTSDNLFASYLPVVCNDSRFPRALSVYQRDVAASRKSHPDFGPAANNVQACAYWKVGSADKPVKIGGRSAADVLMVQNLRDPATPITGARRTQAAFGPHASMVVVNKGDHGAYVYDKNACADAAVTAYLLGGSRPRSDVHCR